jgi:HMGL-like
MSSPTPWITENWFSSPWNYLPEATGAITLPTSLKVHDVTLRDGEQQAGVEFTADEKLRIAELLDNAGVHRIEAGLPAVSPSDEEAVRVLGRDLRVLAVHDRRRQAGHRLRGHGRRHGSSLEPSSD